MDVGCSGRAGGDACARCSPAGSRWSGCCPLSPPTPPGCCGCPARAGIAVGADADLVVLDRTGRIVRRDGERTLACAGRQPRHSRNLRGRRDEPGARGTGVERGFIIPVGGAEEKLERPGDPAAVREALRRSARPASRSSRPPRWRPTPASATRRSFASWAPSTAESLPFEERADCEQRRTARARWSSATGVFLTGGNQLRLATHLGGTPVAKAIRRLNAAGVHVAGTSAGAAFLSEHMIAFGEEGASPRAGIVTLAPGLGLTNRVVIDQHFRQRDRLGRLLTALAYNPFAIGLGLDEDTAAFIGPDDTLEVVGSGAITVVDPSELEYSSMDPAQRQRSGLPDRGPAAHPDPRAPRSTCTPARPRAGSGRVAARGKVASSRWIEGPGRAPRPSDSSATPVRPVTSP